MSGGTGAASKQWVFSKREEGWKGNLRAMWVQRREEVDAGGSQGHEGKLHGEDA